MIIPKRLGLSLSGGPEKGFFLLRIQGLEEGKREIVYTKGTLFNYTLIIISHFPVGPSD